MLPVVWARDALDDATEIAAYISRDNPHAADRMIDLFFSSAETLSLQPYLYRSGRREGTREMIVHPNYILVYRVEAAHIRVINVVHTSRQYP